MRLVATALRNKDCFDECQKVTLRPENKGDRKTLAFLVQTMVAGKLVISNSETGEFCELDFLNKKRLKRT